MTTPTPTHPQDPAHLRRAREIVFNGTPDNSTWADVHYAATILRDHAAHLEAALHAERFARHWLVWECETAPTVGLLGSRVHSEGWMRCDDDEASGWLERHGYLERCDDETLRWGLTEDCWPLHRPTDKPHPAAPETFPEPTPA